MIDAGRLAALKAYCRIDYDDDDSLLEAILGTVDAYLQAAPAKITRTSTI